MQKILAFPNFSPFAPEMRGELAQFFAMESSGISELSYCSMFLHSEKYGYEVSRADGSLIVSFSSPKNGEKKFWTLGDFPQDSVVKALFETHSAWENIRESDFLGRKEFFDGAALQVSEDRDNFDYLYLKSDLAALRGRAFHKKKNLVNAFLADNKVEVRELSSETTQDALFVLDEWNKGRECEITDYNVAKKALKFFSALGMTGQIAYADGVPAGWHLGEIVEKNSTFCCHFEKGISKFRGVYQFLNWNAAKSLPDSIKFINREQDLGDEGLRQAKESYRPCGFVKKYRAKIGDEGT